MAMYFLGLLPTTLLKLYILWVGGGAVLRSRSNYNLVFGSVGAIFLLDIDKGAYRVMVPPTTKNMVQGAQPFNLEVGEGSFFELRAASIKYYPFFISAITIMISTIIWQIWCGEFSRLQEV